MPKFDIKFKKPPTPPTATDKPATEAELKSPAMPVVDTDSVKCTLHLDTIEKEMIKQYAGKHGYNPYKWITDNIKPLRAALLAGDKSPVLYSKILALKAVEPKI